MKYNAIDTKEFSIYLRSREYWSEHLTKANGSYRSLIVMRFGPDVERDEATKHFSKRIGRLQFEISHSTNVEFERFRGVAIVGGKRNKDGCLTLIAALGDHDLLPSTSKAAEASLEALLAKSASHANSIGEPYPVFVEVISLQQSDEEGRSIIFEGLLALASKRTVERVGPHGLDYSEFERPGYLDTCVGVQVCGGVKP